MFPFDLTGPEFLVFYIALGVCVVVALRWWQPGGDGSESPAANLSDPYLIAYLRGGKNEALRVATVSLIDRGVLTVSGSKVSTASDRSPNVLRIPIEQSLAGYFQKTAPAASVFKASILDANVYERELIRAGLLPDPQERAICAIKLSAGVFVLWSVALVKISVALSQGRSNIQFLIALTVIFTVLAFKFGLPRLTRKGVATVANLRLLFRSLQLRASTLVAGRNANELLLLAAVFGVGTIPASVFPHAKQLYPQAAPSGSCGSSCGSGCGGGGCGGGCGGCGS
jgi:uncharacterized protein (TIGR04222 family)